MLKLKRFVFIHCFSTDYSFYQRLFTITLCYSEKKPPFPLADLGGGGVPGSRHPYGTQFFCFRIHFHQKAPASEVHTPLTGARPPPTGNPGSTTAFSNQVPKEYTAQGLPYIDFYSRCREPICNVHIPANAIIPRYTFYEPLEG